MCVLFIITLFMQFNHVVATFEINYYYLLLLLCISPHRYKTIPKVTTNSKINEQVLSPLRGQLLSQDHLFHCLSYQHQLLIKLCQGCLMVTNILGVLA